MKDIIIKEVLVPALKRLYEMDFSNIRWGVSERNICARLAHHMENIMHECEHSGLFMDYYVDVEYNRMSDGGTKRFMNSNKLPQIMVCDLLIQSRAEQPNLLAVEMKRSGNYTKRNKDRERLEAMVSSNPVYAEFPCVSGTTLGAFIIYSPDDVIIELYEDRGGHGAKAGELVSDVDTKDDKHKLEFNVSCNNPF